MTVLRARALALLVLFPGCAGPPRLPDRLPAGDDLARVLEACPGTWGIYFRDLRTGETVERGAERVFHAASTMKLLVLLKVERDLEEGKYALDDPLPVEDFFPSAVGGQFRTEAEAEAVLRALGKTLPVRDLLEAMIVESDNLAANLLIRKAGGPEAVNAEGRALGLEKTTVARYIEDGAAFRAGLSSRAQPRELGRLLEAIWRGQAVSERASRHMLGVLGRVGPRWLGLELPEGVRVAHKTGAIEGIRHDVGLITLAPSQAFVLCVLSSDLGDEKAGEAAIARIARLFCARAGVPAPAGVRG